MSVHCVYCGQVNADDMSVCVGCGRTLPPPLAAVSDPEPPAWGPPPPAPEWQQQPEPPPPPRDAGWSPPYAPGSWPPTDTQPPPFAPPQQQWAPPPPQPDPSWGNPANQWQPPPAYGQPGAPGVWGPVAQPFGAVPFDVSDARSKAKSAMICGIVGLLCFGVILGPIALGLGIKAKSTLTRYDVADGQGMAMAGIVLGTVDIIFSLLYFLSLLAR
jgi:hypothetical protein